MTSGYVLGQPQGRKRPLSQWFWRLVFAFDLIVLGLWLLIIVRPNILCWLIYELAR